MMMTMLASTTTTTTAFVAPRANKTQKMLTSYDDDVSPIQSMEFRLTQLRTHTQKTRTMKQPVGVTMPTSTRRRSVVVEAAGGSRFNKKASAAPGKPAPGEPYLVDGKLWVCQGCGYVYDGSKGAWAEDKRCPMCGERRFALKTQGEMQLAIYSLVAVVALVGILFVIPSL